MTKEELEKEANKALDKRMGTVCYINRMNVQIPYTDGYKDSAEPREKRIAYLEKENAGLKSECRTCVYTDSPCVRSDYPSKDGVCSHYKNVFDEIAELIKENKVLAQNLEDTEILNKTYEKRFNDLEKENAELKEFYEKEYFEIADRTADEKIKELEKYQTEVTVDDYSPYDENTWGMMHEEMFVPKELVRVLLKESYALSEHRNDQLTNAKEIISEYINILKGDTKNWKKTQEKAEQFISEVEK